MIKQLKEDIQAVFARDPAARNTLEVLTTYPGIHALWQLGTAIWWLYADACGLSGCCEVHTESGECTGFAIRRIRKTNDE